MSIHRSVINVMESLGYTRTNGCCHGVSLRWLEACLLGEEHLFNGRIDKIAKDGTSLVQRIDAAKKKKGQYLTMEDKELLDVLAFYDSIELYHSPHVHFSLFNAPLIQDDVDIISKVASSAAILSRGGLARIYSEPVIHTQHEIKAYLDGLGVLIEQACAQSKEPLGIVLSSINHAIALTFTPGKGWKFMDINQYPSKSFMINKTNVLAEHIMAGFRQSKSPYRAFNVSIFTTRDHLGLLNIKETFDSFNKSSRMTKEIATREAEEGINLARIAAQYNHVPVIAELAKHDADLNKADEKGVTPAYVAAEKGHTVVLAELANHNKAALNKVLSNGTTLAIIAAQQGHVLAISELAEHNVDLLNQADSEGTTPALIAAQQGHVSVIIELAKHGVDLNQTMRNGETLAFIAAQEGHTSVIAQLIKMGVKVNTPYTASADNLRQFAITRGEKVIKRMNDFIDQQLVLLPQSQTISMMPFHIAVVMGHREISKLLEQVQNERLNANPLLMEQQQSVNDKTIGDGYTFFSSSVEEGLAVNVVKIDPQREVSIATKEALKRKLDQMDAQALPGHDKKRTRYSKGSCCFGTKK